MSDSSGNWFRRILGKVKPKPLARSAWAAPARPAKSSPARRPAVAAGSRGASGSAQPPQASDGIPVIWNPGDTILDLYEVTGVLGEGGMGVVHKVRHKGWNTDLAVKSPKPEVFGRAGGMENFERECETWVNLNLHPHTR